MRVRYPEGSYRRTEVSELAKVDLEEVIGMDLEQFLDHVSDSVGYPLLQDIQYVVEGHEGDTLLVRVTGYVEEAV